MKLTEKSLNLLAKIVALSEADEAPTMETVLENYAIMLGVSKDASLPKNHYGDYRKLKSIGLSLNEIGRIYGLSRQMVYLVLKTPGYKRRKAYGKRTPEPTERIPKVPKVPEARADRTIRLFWERVDRSGGENSCWNWTGSVTPTGYGDASVGRMRTAHRAAYYLTHGDIPVDKCVMHLCNNRVCCNPAHLKLGTAKENAAMREERYINGDFPRSNKKKREKPTHRQVN